MDDYFSEAEIAPSARKHGITDEDIRHALKHYWMIRNTDNPAITIYIGPSKSVQLLEIIIVDDSDGLAVIHAMLARSKYLL